MSKRGDATPVYVIIGLVLFAILAVGIFIAVTHVAKLLEKPLGSAEAQAARSNLARLAEAINRLTSLPEPFAMKEVEFSLAPGFVIVGFDDDPITDWCLKELEEPSDPTEDASAPKVQKPPRPECSGSCLCLYSSVSGAVDWGKEEKLVACEPLPKTDKIFTIFGKYLRESRNYKLDDSLRVYYQNMVGGEKDIHALELEQYKEFPFSRDVFYRQRPGYGPYPPIFTLFTDLVLYGQCDLRGSAYSSSFLKPRILSVDKSRVDGKNFILLGGRTSDTDYRRNALLLESNIPLPKEPPPTIVAKKESPAQATTIDSTVYRDDFAFYHDNLGLLYAVVRGKMYRYIEGDALGARWTEAGYTLETLPGPRRAAPSEVTEEMWRLLEEVERFLARGNRPEAAPATAEP